YRRLFRYITSVKHKERGLFCNPSLKRTILSLQRDLFHLDAPLILSSTQWISFRDGLDSRDHWSRVMKRHDGDNVVSY
ncbi:unnamed protein product, partial [Brassica oleracea]